MRKLKFKIDFHTNKQKFYWFPLYYSSPLIWKEEENLIVIEETPTIGFQWGYWWLIIEHGSNSEWVDYLTDWYANKENNKFLLKLMTRK